jgi:DNA-binding NarL/FixJ family response regulator
VEQLVQGLDQGNDPEEFFNALSGREREITSLVVTGMTNREIASTLTITENTVKGHLSNIWKNWTYETASNWLRLPHRTVALNYPRGKKDCGFSQLTPK